MEKKNNLSKNLRTYQEVKRNSLTEFSRELGIPKSTLRSVLRDGNTTLDTAIRLAEGLGISLDELVYGDAQPERFSLVHWLLCGLEWYCTLAEDEQETAAFHIGELLKVVAK